MSKHGQLSIITTPSPYTNSLFYPCFLFMLRFFFFDPLLLKTLSSLFNFSTLLKFLQSYLFSPFSSDTSSHTLHIEKSKIKKISQIKKNKIMKNKK